MPTKPEDEIAALTIAIVQMAKMLGRDGKLQVTQLATAIESAAVSGVIGVDAVGAAKSLAQQIRS